MASSLVFVALVGALCFTLANGKLRLEYESRPFLGRWHELKPRFCSTTSLRWAQDHTDGVVHQEPGGAVQMPEPYGGHRAGSGTIRRGVPQSHLLHGLQCGWVHPSHRSREGAHHHAGCGRCLHCWTVQLPHTHYAGETGGRLCGLSIRSRDQEGISTRPEQSARHAQ